MYDAAFRSIRATLAISKRLTFPQVAAELSTQLTFQVIQLPTL